MTKFFLAVALSLILSAQAFAYSPKQITVIGHSLAPSYVDLAYPPNGYYFDNSTAYGGCTLSCWWEDARLPQVLPEMQEELQGNLETSAETADIVMSIMGANDLVLVSAFSGEGKVDQLIVLMKEFYLVRLGALGITPDKIIIFNEYPWDVDGLNYKGDSVLTEYGALGNGTAAVDCTDYATCLAAYNQNANYFRTVMKSWAATVGITYVDVFQNVYTKYDGNTDAFSHWFTHDGVHGFLATNSCSSAYDADDCKGCRSGLMCPTGREVYNWWVLPALIDKASP